VAEVQRHHVISKRETPNKTGMQRKAPIRSNAKASKAAKLNNFMKEISRNLVNYSPLKTSDLPMVSIDL